MFRIQGEEFKQRKCNLGTEDIQQSKRCSGRGAMSLVKEKSFVKGVLADREDFSGSESSSNNKDAKVSNMRGVPAEEDIGKHNEQFQQRKVLGTERGTEEDI